MISQKKRFPIPNVEEITNILQGSQYFNTTDLENEFYLVELEEET